MLKVTRETKRWWPVTSQWHAQHSHRFAAQLVSPFHLTGSRQVSIGTDTLQGDSYLQSVAKWWCFSCELPGSTQAVVTSPAVCVIIDAAVPYAHNNWCRFKQNVQRSGSVRVWVEVSKPCHCFLLLLHIVWEWMWYPHSKHGDENRFGVIHSGVALEGLEHRFQVGSHSHNTRGNVSLWPLSESKLLSLQYVSSRVVAVPPTLTQTDNSRVKSVLELVSRTSVIGW